MIKNKKFIKTTTASLLIVLFIIPINSQAATEALSYKPQTKQEVIAYLYGRISQLLEIQQSLGKSSGVTSPSQSQFNFVSIETHGATDVTNTTAILRGEIVLFGKATVSAWFEYGRDSDFLDQRTSKINVRSAYDRAVRIQVNNLKDDERYYFRIVTEDNSKFVQYGSVYAFRTDESEN